MTLFFNTIFFFVFGLMVALAIAGGLKLKETGPLAGISLRAGKWVGLYAVFIAALGVAAFFLPQEKLLPCFTQAQVQEYQQITQEAIETAYSNTPVSIEQLQSLQGMCLLSQQTYPFTGEELLLQPTSGQLTLVLVEEQAQRTGDFRASMYNTPLVVSPYSGCYVDVTQRVQVSPLPLDGSTLWLESVDPFGEGDAVHILSSGMGSGSFGVQTQEASFARDGLSVLVLEVPTGLKVTLLPYGQEEPLGFVTVK